MGNHGRVENPATAHKNAMDMDADKEMHKQIAILINRVIAAGNLVRRP